MIHHDDRERRFSRLWNLQNSSDGQAVAGIFDEIAGEHFGIKQGLADDNLAALEFMLSQSLNGEWIQGLLCCARGGR